MYCLGSGHGGGGGVCLVSPMANPITRAITRSAVMAPAVRFLPLQRAKKFGAAASYGDSLGRLGVTTSFSLLNAFCFPSAGTTSRPETGVASTGYAILGDTLAFERLVQFKDENSRSCWMYVVPFLYLA
jgi:hypothetical protein